MPCIAFAARPIDVAIFGTLGLLWIFGALFIVALYRWIRRFEHEQDPHGPDLVPRTIVVPAVERPSSVVPRPAVAREHGAAHPAS